MPVSFKGFPLQSMHRLLRRQGHDDGMQGGSHIVRKLSEADGLRHVEMPFLKPSVCTGNHSRGSPFDSSGRRLSGISRQTPCCGRPAVDPLSEG